MINRRFGTKNNDKAEIRTLASKRHKLSRLAR
jgi:hypothetical protein